MHVRCGYVCGVLVKWSHEIGLWNRLLAQCWTLWWGLVVVCEAVALGCKLRFWGRDYALVGMISWQA